MAKRYAQKALVGLFLGVILVLVFYPTLMLVVGSFRSAPLGAPASEWTLQGWQRAYGRSETYTTLWTTVRLALYSTVLSTGIAIFLAWIVARTNTPGRWLFERLFFAPLLLPGLLIALSWAIIGSPRTGLLSRVLAILPGVPEGSVSIYNMGGLVFVAAITLTPIAYFLIVSSLKTMDHSLEEAAAASGAGPARTALKVTLPMVAPAILAGATLVAIKVLESFDLPVVLGRPAGIEVFMTKIFYLIRFNPQPDYATATALAIILVLIMGLLIAMQIRYTNKRSFITVGGKGANRKAVDLGRWRYATAGVCWLYVALAVVVPVGIVVLGSFQNIIGIYDWEQLTLEHWEEVLSSSEFGSVLRNTLVVCLCSGFFMTVASGLLGYLIVRTKSAKAKWALEGTGWLPWGIPTVVLGIGLLWAYTFAPGNLQATIWVLVIGYVTVLLPVGVRLFVAAVEQLDPGLEEAARMSGAASGRLVAQILAPLLVRTIMYSFLFGFVIGVREVGLPALLATPGNAVLGSTTLFAWVEGAPGISAVYGVVMLAVSLAAIVVLGLLELALRYVLPLRGRRLFARPRDTTHPGVEESADDKWAANPVGFVSEEKR